MASSTRLLKLLAKLDPCDFALGKIAATLPIATELRGHKASSTGHRDSGSVDVVGG